MVDRLMQKAPESRYSGADEVVEALRPFTDNASPRRGFSGSGPRPNLSRFAPSQEAAPAPIPQPEPARPPVVPSFGEAAPARPTATAPSRFAPQPTVASRPVPPSLPSAAGYGASAFPSGTGASASGFPNAPTGATNFGNSGSSAYHQSLPQQYAEALPVTPVSESAGIMPTSEPPEQLPRRSAIGPFLIISVTAIIIVVAYVLGQKFLGK